LAEQIIRKKYFAASVQDFDFDWAASGELPAGVTITASSWAASAGLTAAGNGFTGTTTSVRLSGGTLGQWYTVTNHVTRSDGQTRDFTIHVVVRELSITREKDPDTDKDLTVFWNRAQQFASGETITASEWTIPTGLTLVTELFTAAKTVARIRGGTLGTTYTCLNYITTSAGQELYCAVAVPVVAQ